MPVNITGSNYFDDLAKTISIISTANMIYNFKWEEKSIVLANHYHSVNLH